MEILCNDVQIIQRKVQNMPRCARVKTRDSIYHIMVRSISDTLLFKSNDDKDMFLHILKKYKKTFMFSVYAYCLMDTHAHILIDCNGADISKIMHCINQCYAQYFNRVHKRRGHLFQDRFKSVIKHTDKAVIDTSAYINKNPKDLKGYNGVEEKYKYSSFPIYAGILDDEYGILDQYYILNQFSTDPIIARAQYFQFVKQYNEESETDYMEFRHERAEYRSERVLLVRNINPEKVVEFVAAYTKTDKRCINIKYIKKVREAKALCALIMRCLCDMSEKVICGKMGNITQSHVARLYNIGIQLIEEKDEYKNIINDFLAQIAA